MHRLLIPCAVLASWFGCSDTPPIVEEFCVNGCFDGDDCTDDICQGDGSCLNVPRNPFGACTIDAHCDDGNPCSVDTCALDDCGLMRCSSDFGADNCVPCGSNFGPCDDFNPCTVETCRADDTCQFDPSIDPSCDPSCNQSAALSADVAASGYFGYLNWYVGVATTPNGTNCDGTACSCEGELRLKDSSEGFELREAAGANDPRWGCDIVACEPRATSCRPLDSGVGYVVWGTMSYLNQFDARSPTPDTSPDSGASADVASFLPIDALLVEGYCLSTRLDHVVGDYAASFESNGKKATFDLRIARDESGVMAHMGTCTGCAATGLTEGQTVALGADTGTVSFPLALGITPGFARLYARTDRFVGDLRKEDKGFLGMIELERIAP